MIEMDRKRNRNIMDMRTETIHRSRYYHSPAMAIEDSICMRRFPSTQWASVTDQPVNCMECIDAGA